MHGAYRGASTRQTHAFLLLTPGQDAGAGESGSEREEISWSELSWPLHGIPFGREGHLRKPAGIPARPALKIGPENLIPTKTRRRAEVPTRPAV